MQISAELQMFRCWIVFLASTRAGEQSAVVVQFPQIGITLQTRHLYPGFSERSVSAMAAHSCDPAPNTAWHCRGPAFTTLSVMSIELTLVLFGSIFNSIQPDKARCKRTKRVNSYRVDKSSKWVFDLLWKRAKNGPEIELSNSTSLSVTWQKLDL